MMKTFLSPRRKDAKEIQNQNQECRAFQLFECSESSYNCPGNVRVGAGDQISAQNPSHDQHNGL